MQKSQRGFTLVAVLILSGLASILVLSSIKDNVNQERLSGNFQKKINARLMSERGIFDTMAEAKRYLDNNPTADVNELATNIVDLSKEDSTGLSYGEMKYTVQFVPDGDELVLSSTGKRFEGQSTLKARFKIVPASGGSAPFSSAIVGCDSVDLVQSGQIDSYNSSVAPYDKFSPGTEGNVTTINKDNGDVTLGDASPVKGDISATGNVNLGKSSVTGSVHANGNVIILESGNGERVSGNVITRGNFEFTGGAIGGYVRAQKIASTESSDATGNISLTKAKVLNKNNVGLDIMYGGTYSYLFDEEDKSPDYTSASFNTNPYVPKVKDSGDSKDPTDPATNCDYLKITSEINKIDDGNNDLKDFKTKGWSISYTMLPSKLSLDSEDETAEISSVNVNVFDKPTEVFKVSKFEVHNDTIFIEGDVTIFVDGDFVMSGSPEIKVLEDSSLTLIVTGKVILGGSAKITTEVQSLTESGLAPFRIYSSYGGEDTGINLSGALEMYAQIYAPLAKVDISGSGELFGAIRGKTVAVSGGAKIHYDAALGATSQGSGSSGQQASLQFVGFEY